jgi:hypothetical protein
MEPSYIGVVKFVHHKGYFFIVFGGREIYCHMNRWTEFAPPVTGQLVSFTVTKSRDTRFQYEAASCRPVAQDVQNGAAVLATPTTEGR